MNDNNKYAGVIARKQLLRELQYMLEELEDLKRKLALITVESQEGEVDKIKFQNLSKQFKDYQERQERMIRSIKLHNSKSLPE